MQGFVNWLSQPYALMLSFAVLLVIFLLPLYIRVARQQKEMEKRLEQIEDSFASNLHQVLDAMSAERSLDREELGNNLRGMSDSVVKIMGEMLRSQQQQLDSFGGQIRAMSRTDEDRMDRMRGSIGEKLQDYDRQMARVVQGLDERFLQSERRLMEMRQMLVEGLLRLQTEIDKKLDVVRETMDGQVDNALDKHLGESFRSVSDRLDQVYKGLGEMQTLSDGVGDLKKVLTAVNARGVWGEAQLGKLLEQVLTPDQYEKNVTVKPGSGELVEYAVRLPGKNAAGPVVYLPIDSKFPTDSYQKLLSAAESGDKQAIDEAARALEATVRSEARRIRMTHVDPPHTTDFAIMFLPFEGLFAEVLKFAGIVEQLQSDFRVIITGPTTLLALLNSLQMGFRTVALEQRTGEVWQLLGAVKVEFGRFSSILSKTRQRLNQATASIDDAARKTRTIQQRLQNVKELSDQEVTRLDLRGGTNGAGKPARKNAESESGEAEDNEDNNEEPDSGDAHRA